MDFDAEETSDYIDAQLQKSEKTLKAESKKKANTSGALNAAEFKQAKEAQKAHLASLQAEVDYWKAMKKLHNDKRNEEAKKVDAQLYEKAVAQAEEDKRTKAEKEAEQAEVGANAVNPKLKAKWNEAHKEHGKTDEIVLPNGQVVKGHYVLVESGTPTPSHQSDNGFTETEGFPVDENGQSVNDRDYKRDKEAQQVTLQMADNYDQRAVQTPVVVSKDGVVLSGNGRTMAGEIAARQGTDTKYNDYLRANADKYGFTEEQVSQYKHPRVVFEADAEMPYDATTFAKFNQREQKSQSKTEQAVKMGKVVDDNLFGRVMDTVGHFDTLADFYADDKATYAVIKALAESGIIPQTEMAALFDGGKLSEQGQALVENILIGKVFEGNPDAVREITEVKSVRKAVMNALQSIVTNNRLGGGYALSDELSQAIDLVYKARQAGYKVGDRVSEFARQGNLFEEDGATVADYRNATIMMLADVLNDSRVTQLKKVVEAYNERAEVPAQGIEDMFVGKVSKEQIINEIRKAFNYGQSEQDQSTAPLADGQGSRSSGSEQGTPIGTSHSEGERGERLDKQGNPINDDGTLKVEEIKLVDELTDEDFSTPTRNVQLPQLPQNVDNAIGAEEKPVVIKKNIFGKNHRRHKDLTPKQSRKILLEALYNTNMYGQNQKTTRPYNWILIHNDKLHSAIIVEVDHNKDNVEIVNWHFLDNKTLKQKENQAINEGGLILTLKSAVGNTKDELVSTDKGTNKKYAGQAKNEENDKNWVHIVPHEPEVQNHDWSQYKEGDVYQDGEFKCRFEYVFRDEEGFVTGVIVSPIDEYGNLGIKQNLFPLMFIHDFKKVSEQGSSTGTSIPASERGEVVDNIPQEYTYQLTQRPFGIGSQPEGQLRHVDDGSKFGSVVYDHPLSAEEVKNFSLVPITEAKALEGRTFEVPFGDEKDIYHVDKVDDDGTIHYHINDEAPLKARYHEFLSELGDEAKEIKTDSKTGDETLLDVDGNPVVVKTDDDTIELNYRTWQEEKEQVRAALEDGGLDPEFIDGMMAQADIIAEAMKELFDKYPLFGAYQNKEKGKQHILRNTGEYLSWDYSFNCVKKDALNAVIESIVGEGNSTHLGITQIEALKTVLQKHGFLVPCAMCYVEAKRKIYKQSKEVAAKWNAVAEAAGLPKVEIGEKREITEEQRKILNELAKGKGLDRVNNYTTGKDEEGKDEDGIKADTIKKIAKLMLNSPELCGTMKFERMMTPSSFSKMYNEFAHTGLMDFLTQGQSRGKSLLEAVPFSLSNIPRDLLYDMYCPPKLADIGGMRQFSYEDARAMMFFDYYQQFMVMQGARALEHLYTKRPFMPEMFGKTGAMMNQSLIVDIFKGADWHKKALGLSDKEYTQWLSDNAGFIPKGALAKDNPLYEEGSTELVPNYSVESFPIDIAMKNIHNPEYNSCVGNVIVAPNVKFILWALDNPEIHQILAYHANGANPIMKSLTGYDLAKPMDDGYHTKKNGKAIEKLVDDNIGLEIKGKVLLWNKLLRKNGYDARKAAQVYLDYCKEHGLTPMFCYEGVVDMSGEKATSHPNYYKLLTDFRVYDDEGKSIRQRNVKAVLPDNWKEILDKYLNEEQTTGERVKQITLDESLQQEIYNVTRYASMESNERNTFVKLLTDVYGKDNISVCGSKDFDKMLDEAQGKGTAEMLRNKGGIVYGFAVGDKIVLNEDYFNAHTPMHEHTHIFMKVLQATNPRLYQRGMELWRGTKLWEKARQGLEMLGDEATDEKIFSECISQFTGSENERIISEVTGITDKKWLSKAMTWIKDLWNGVKSAFSRWTGAQLDDLTAEQFGNMPIRALYDEKERKAYKEKLNQYKKAKDILNGKDVELHSSLDDDKRIDHAALEAATDLVRIALGHDSVITNWETAQKVLDDENGRARKMSFGEPYNYDKYPRGRVEPNLAEKSVSVVH